ncbi:MAG: hypothetical protein QXE01_10100 [Sulfolobales archaeon]
MARLFRTRHGVYSLGDARELIKEIPSGSVDAIITDPPYGVGKDRFDDGEVFFELEDELYRVLRDHGWLIFLVPFAGYGSIPLTCELFGRRWIAFEIDREKYVFARKLVGSISGIEEER